jgi:hypothetical protein
MKEPKPITYAEVMSNMEKFISPKGGQNRYPFTPEMDKLILKAQKSGVSFTRIAKLWEELGWGRIAHSTVVAQYKRLVEEK